MAKPVLVTRKRNVTGSVSLGQQIGFRFTVFNTTRGKGAYVLLYIGTMRTDFLFDIVALLLL